MVLTDPQNHLGEVFEGSFNVDQLQKFLSSYAYSKPKKTVRLEFLRLDEHKVTSNVMCGGKQTDFCVLIDAGWDDGMVERTLGKLNPAVP